MLPVHALVLASASPGHFRGQILRLSQDQGQLAAQVQAAEQPVPLNTSTTTEDEPASKRAKTAAPQPGPRVLELTCYPGEPHTVPEAVMRHAYTGALPDDPSLLAWVRHAHGKRQSCCHASGQLLYPDSQLVQALPDSLLLLAHLQMLWRADYLDMEGTIDACLAKLDNLSKHGKLTMQDAAILSSLPTLQTRKRAAVEQVVASLESNVLKIAFGEVRKVLLDDKLLGQFVQMDYQQLRKWVQIKERQVDSENTVAVLLAAWYDHQLTIAGSGSTLTEQQCEELSSFLRLGRLSPSFHLQALPHLKWFRAPAGLPEQHGLARFLVRCNHNAAWPKLAGQQASSSTAAERCWRVTDEQLDTLWNEKKLSLEPGIYFAGFEAFVSLELKKTDDSRTTSQEFQLQLFVHCDWCDVLLKHGLDGKVGDGRQR